MLLETLGTRLLGNMLVGKGIVRARYGSEEEGIIRAGYGSKRSSIKKKLIPLHPL